MSSSSHLPDRETIHKKLRQTAQLYEFAYTLKKTQITRKHPDWSQQQINERVRELMQRN